MRVLVVGSCGKKKRFSSTKAPTCNDLAKQPNLESWVEKLSPLTCAARSMYTGNQARELARGVDLLRSINNIEVDFFIISAGFGLLGENEKIPPYECSFSKMKKAQIREWSKKLSIAEDFKKICSKKYDLSYFALGTKYLIALGDEWYHSLGGTIITFSMFSDEDRFVILPSGAEIVRSFSSSGHKIHGVAGFKGDLLRILAQHAMHKSKPYTEISKWTQPGYLSGIFYDISR